MPARPRAGGARARKKSLWGRRPRSRALRDLFDEIEAHWRGQHRADNALIDELKHSRPRPQRLFAAIRAGARWDRGLDCDGIRRPIHCAALHCKDPWIFELARRLGADFLATDAQGDLFFHWALTSRNLPAVSWWIQRGFPARAPDHEGLSPCELCLASGDADFWAELTQALPESFSREDLQSALDRVELVLGSSACSFPGHCAEGAIDLIEADPFLARPSRALSETLESQGLSEAARRARGFESLAISREEALALGQIAPELPTSALSRPRSI